MNLRQALVLLHSLASLFIILLAQPAPCHAGEEVSDTVVKRITGILRSTSINFNDPDNGQFHVELSVDDPAALSFDRTSDDLAHGSFTVTARKYGSFTVAVHYRSLVPGHQNDTGTEYVRIDVEHEPKFPRRGIVKGTDSYKVVALEQGNDPAKPDIFGVATAYGFYSTNTLSMLLVNSRPHLVWEPPENTTIVDIARKAGDNEFILILLSDGTIYYSQFSYRLFDFTQPIQAALYTGNGTYREIIGDAIYARSSTSVDVTRDQKTWEPDTAGFMGAIPSNMAMDSSQGVWLATSRGVLKQGASEDVWQKVASFPSTNVTAIFVDHRDRIYAVAQGGIYISIDRGGTWVLDSAGIDGKTITSFGDDVFGNVYAIATNYQAANHLFRLNGGTGAWHEIGGAIRSLAVDSSQTILFRSIAGDSTLLLATVFGLYASTDQGGNWNEANEGFESRNIYAFIKRSDGSSFISTNRGIYQGQLDDTLWTERYPTEGLRSGAPLFSDRNGSLYTQGPTRTVNYNSALPITYRSTDGGVAWQPDSSGIGNVPLNGLFYVDPDGVQHVAVSGLSSTPSHIFSKAPGKEWAADEIGFAGKPNEYAGAFGADSHGNTFLAMNDNGREVVWKRTAASGAWEADTAGLNGTAIYQLTAGRNGDIYGATSYGIFKFDGSYWSLLPNPQGTSSTTGTFAISVDSSGALWGAFSDIPDYYHITPIGVYATTDNGANWSRVGLDSIGANPLVSYGDTTYAVTSRGLFSLTRDLAAAVPVPIVGSSPPGDSPSFGLYPDPSISATTIRYLLPRRGAVSIWITDLRGREIIRLLDRIEEAGGHTLSLDGRGLSSGIYVCRMEADSGVVSRLLLIRK